MLVAISISVLAVAAGSALALVPRESPPALGMIRTFALTASLGAVLAHLVPEAIETLGAVSLPALVAGLLLPVAIERGAHAVGRWRGGHGERSVALDAAFLGLLVHHAGDGLGLGAYMGERHAGHFHHDIVLALTVHTIPVATMVVLAFDTERGRPIAIRRAATLALSGAVGVVASTWLPNAPSSLASAWVSALVAGLLVHVVTHELRAQPPRSTVARSADLFAAGLGIAISCLGTSEAAHHAHAHDAGFARANFLQALLDVALGMSPVLLLGIFVGAALQLQRVRSDSLRASGSLSVDIVRAASFGATLPASPAGTEFALRSLIRQGAPAAAAVTWMATIPAFGAEAFALTVYFMGWPFAVLRLVGALLLAAAAAVAVAHARLPAPASVDRADARQNTHSIGSARRLFVALDARAQSIGAWVVVGTLAAAAVQAFLPESAIAGASLWTELPLITLFAVPATVCAPAAIPLVGVLIAKGLSPGAALAALLLGPIFGATPFSLLCAAYGPRSAYAATAAVVAVSWLLAFGVNAWIHTDDVRLGTSLTPTTALCSLVLAALLLKGVWQSGLRAWLAALAPWRSDAET